jgi:hypothetical protein
LVERYRTFFLDFSVFSVALSSFSARVPIVTLEICDGLASGNGIKLDAHGQTNNLDFITAG